MEKAWFMTPVECNPNGNGITAQWKRHGFMRDCFSKW